MFTRQNKPESWYLRIGSQGRYFLSKDRLDVMIVLQLIQCILKTVLMQSAMTFESLKSNSKDKKVIVQ